MKKKIKRRLSTSESSTFEDSNRESKRKIKRERSSKSSHKSKKKKKYSDNLSSDKVKKKSPKPRKHSSSESSTSEISKKRKKQKNKNRLKKKKSKSKNDEIISNNVSSSLTNAIKAKESEEQLQRSLAMRPMTRAEWEARQSVVRRVYDEETGRTRLVKGDGEILEEIVSRERHLEINKLATKGDGASFEARLGLANNQ